MASSLPCCWLWQAGLNITAGLAAVFAGGQVKERDAAREAAIRKKEEMEAKVAEMERRFVETVEDYE